jgi:hypothetical protein
MRAPATALAAVAAVSIGLFGLMGTASGQARGRNPKGPPPEPAPRSATGRVVLTAKPDSKNGVWTPRFGISDPIAKLETVPFQPWAKALYTDRQRHELEPHARCKPSGAARQFLTPYGVEFVEFADLGKLLIFDIGGPHTFRTIYTDGRSHPDNFTPTNYGHSIGWWEGDTFVVDTVGYNEDFWLDRRGLPHTDQLHTIERFLRTNKDTIDYKITIDDPGAYTKPYEGGFNLGYDESTELFEYVCQQANYAHELMVGGESRTISRSSTIIP